MSSIHRLVPRSLLLLGLLLVGAFPARPSPVSEGFVLIVNAKNPVESLSRDQVARLFLKKDLRFAGGLKAEPVDRDGESVARRLFTSKIHLKDIAAIKSYWQRQLFSGRESPPAELSSDREVVEFVGRTPGGIGYVSTESPLAATVKVLSIE